MRHCTQGSRELQELSKNIILIDDLGCSYGALMQNSELWYVIDAPSRVVDIRVHRPEGMPAMNAEEYSKFFKTTEPKKLTKLSETQEKDMWKVLDEYNINPMLFPLIISEIMQVIHVQSWSFDDILADTDPTRGTRITDEDWKTIQNILRK